MLHGYEIIDAHCHIYPDSIAARAVAGIGNFYGAPTRGAGTVADLTARGAEAGVDRFLVQSVATNAHQVRAINEFICDVASRSGGRMIGLGTLYPDSPDLAGDYAHLRALGLHGVKLHPDFQRFKIDDYRCLKIYELCERDRMPILMHTGDHRYDFSNPNRMLPILQIYTELTVVGAHFGGWSVWDEASETLRGLPNFYVDCSSTMGFLQDPSAVRRLFEAYGADRVLFGADYPMWNVKDELEMLFALGLPAADLRRILSENAKRVYRFE